MSYWTKNIAPLDTSSLNKWINYHRETRPAENSNMSFWAKKIAPLNTSPISRWISHHGGTRPVEDKDWVRFFGGTFICCLVIAYTPPNKYGRFIRAGIACPIWLCFVLWWVLFHADKNGFDEFGRIAGSQWHVIKALEFLAFDTPEKTKWRVRRIEDFNDRKVVTNGSAKGVQGYRIPDGWIDLGNGWMKENVPPDYTIKKLFWVISLWWGQRGIGWNCAIQLGENVTRYPYSKDTTRWQYFRSVGLRWIIEYLLADLARAYMNCGPGVNFFSGKQGPFGYYTLSTAERALYGLAVAVRVYWSVAAYGPVISLPFIAYGGVTGIDNEMTSPWGWPHLFGGLSDIWRHPGLSHMWSKTWHQHFRYWVTTYIWQGLGEKILRLPASSETPPTSSRAPTKSGRVSPSHPVPSNPKAASSRNASLIMMISNLIKSTMVFITVALLHDIPLSMTQIHQSPGKEMKFRNCIMTMPFFLCQPLALAVDAMIKRRWRKYKRSHLPKSTHSVQIPASSNPKDFTFSTSTSASSSSINLQEMEEKSIKSRWQAIKVKYSPGKKPKPNGHSSGDEKSNGLNGLQRTSSGHSTANKAGKDTKGETYEVVMVDEPKWMIFVERLGGFVCTWYWLGWTGQWFVRGFVESELFRQDLGQDQRFSVMGGLIYGKWAHAP